MCSIFLTFGRIFTGEETQHLWWRGANKSFQQAFPLFIQYFCFHFYIIFLWPLYVEETWFDYNSHFDFFLFSGLWCFWFLWTLLCLRLWFHQLCAIHVNLYPTRTLSKTQIYHEERIVWKYLAWNKKTCLSINVKGPPCEASLSIKFFLNIKKFLTYWILSSIQNPCRSELGEEK